MLSDYISRNVPEYYKGMHLAGYSPEQIMNAKRRQMHSDFIKKNESPEIIIPNITFKSVVKIQ